MPKDIQNQTDEDQDELASATQGKASIFSSQKKLIVIIISFIILALIGAGTFFYVRNMLFKQNSPKEEKTALLRVVFVSLPEIIVNLKSSKTRGSILKATFMLELNSPQEKEEIERLKPIIVDQFQTFLRELDVGDLQGAVGLERMRQELFNRVNAIITPIKIRRILFRDFLIQ